MAMLCLTNTSVLLDERIRKLRYIVFGFLLFDLVYGTVLMTLFEGVRANMLGYHTLTLLYVCSILAGMFGVKDKISLLLYPILIFIVPLIVGCFFFFFANIIQLFVCWRYNAAPVFQIPMPMVDFSCRTPDSTINQSLISGFVEFFILMDKFLEFFVIRKLMNLLTLMKVSTTVEVVRRRSIQPSTARTSRNTITSYDRSQPEKVMSDIKDSDDDMVVYQSQSRKFHNDFLQSTTSRPSIPPPVYRETVITPQSEEILPIKKQSKHGIE